MYELGCHATFCIELSGNVLCCAVVRHVAAMELIYTDKHQMALMHNAIWSRCSSDPSELCRFCQQPHSHSVYKFAKLAPVYRCCINRGVFCVPLPPPSGLGPHGPQRFAAPPGYIAPDVPYVHRGLRSNQPGRLDLHEWCRGDGYRVSVVHN